METLSHVKSGGGGGGVGGRSGAEERRAGEGTFSASFSFPCRREVDVDDDSAWQSGNPHQKSVQLVVDAARSLHLEWTDICVQI